MRRRIFLVLATATGAAALSIGAPAARAEPEPLSAEARRRAERSFALGRLEDVPALLGASNALVDREPVEVLNRYWRPAGTNPGPIRDVDEGSVSSRRLRWLEGWPTTDGEPYPAPREGEAEPHPVLTALLRDRRRRESRGVEGLPQESPLAALADDAVQAFLPHALRAFAATPPPPAPGAPPDPDVELAERAAAVGRRNAGVAAAAGLAFLLAALGLTWRLGRGRLGAPSRAMGRGGDTS